MSGALLTDVEVSAWLAVPRGTLAAWRHRRAIPFIKLGRAVRYRRDELERWLAERAVPDGDELASRRRGAGAP